ncbi:MAG: JAB domain-containing protein [Pseudomonadales bacterium]|nr:JAB domain-containing protein [Pseudomonadales bacterium]
MNKDTSSLPVRLWQKSEQPRTRILNGDAAALTLAELLAVCLGSGSVGESAVMLCTRLLSKFGDLDGLLQASTRELLATHGLGEAKVAHIKAQHELALRYSEERLRAKPLCLKTAAQAHPNVAGDAEERMSDLAAVSRFLQRKLAFSHQEVFGCLYLDTRQRFIKFEILFKGSINRAHVYPRELIKRCIDLGAAAVILTHNHPSGIAEPSQADLEMTRILITALQHIDVKILDHIVVSNEQTFSLASHGLLI